jgi:hypothetical protein
MAKASVERGFQTRVGAHVVAELPHRLIRADDLTLGAPYNRTRARRPADFPWCSSHGTGIQYGIGTLNGTDTNRTFRGPVNLVLLHTPDP